MGVVLIAGSPSERSRSAALLDAVAQRLQFRGAQVDHLHIRELSAQALILGDFGHPTISLIDSQVSVTESGAYELNVEIAQRLDQALDTLVRDVLPAAEVHAKRFSPVHFSQVRCSV